MESIQITQEPIDLYEFRVTDKDSERQAITEIQSQILKCIEDEGYGTQVKSVRCNSILLNKLTYYIANEIERKNPRMIIGRGWYKYGPCYDEGRQGEASFTLKVFDYLRPSKNVLPEVEEICKTEVPLFLSSTERNQFYPFEYLKHIYTDKVDHPEIKNFYLAKHFFAGFAIDCQTDPKNFKLGELNRFTMNFDREISVSPYRSIVGISQNDSDLILEFTALMNQILTDAYKNPSEKQRILASKVTNDFINIVLMTFANKNYIYTFKTSNYRHGEKVKESNKKAYKGYINKTESLIHEYYQALNN